MVDIRFGYSDGPGGQVHWRMAAPGTPTTGPDLYCLAPAPFSGLAWQTMLPHLAKGRRVFAPDFPGYGGSPRADGMASITSFAAAITAVIAEQSKDRPVDLAGFHSGCLVAVAIAGKSGSKARKLTLVDLPYFAAPDRATMLSQIEPFEPTSDLVSIKAIWERGMTRRVESQGIDRSLDMVTDQLRSGRHVGDAFHAAFSFDADTALRAIAVPTAVIASQSGLLTPSRDGAALIPGATLIERLDIKRAVLDEAAESTATEIINFLNM